MQAHIQTQAGTLSRLLAAMPSHTLDDCREQDLAAADAVEQIAIACEGNGDAYSILMDAVADIRACVADSEEREQIERRNAEHVRRRVMREAA